MSVRPRFVIVVFDALRPDMVSPATAPNLAAFMAAGCHYPNSRAVFPSETRVNTTSFATGTRPARHGIIANSFFDPRLAGSAPFDTGKSESLRRADEAYADRVVTAPTLGEALHRAGLRLAVVSSGTPGNARFLNPHAARLGQPTFSVHGPDACSTPAVHAEVTARCGLVPAAGVPNLDRVAYATDVLLNHMLPAVEPDVAVVWFSEPDLSYHYRGIGSPDSLAAIRAVDLAFGRILDWRRAQPDGERIQIVTLSDHGQIATGERLDPIAALRSAGFGVAPALGPDAAFACVPGYSGNILARDGRRLGDLVAWMQEQPWCGLLFTPGTSDAEGPVPGTFGTAALGGRHDRTPHLQFTLRGDDAPNAFGMPGGCLHANDLPRGGGIHGGAHPRELNNVLAFGGSLFRERHTIGATCDITCLAPTILHCLGIPAPDQMTGRVLAEAIAGEEPDAATGTLTVGHGRYQQTLRLTRVGASVYLDGGWRE